jgi:DNA-binding GntR family transcriptional regulator
LKDNALETLKSVDTSAIVETRESAHRSALGSFTQILLLAEKAPGTAEGMGCSKLSHSGQDPWGQRVEVKQAEPFNAELVAADFSEMDWTIARLLKVNSKLDSVASVISVVLAREIIEEVRAPGDEINSLEISKRFNTSRTPAREALVILENEGLVEIEARKRPRVADVSTKTLREVYELRAELYGLLARKVARNGTATDFQRLESIVDDLRLLADGPVGPYFLKNVLFHEQLALAANDPTLKAAIDGLGLRVLKFRRMALQRTGLQRRSFEDHHRLVQALEERDADLAAALNKSIVLTALARLTA